MPAYAEARNPFAPEPQELPEFRYAETLRQLARRFIYEDVDIKTIDEDIRTEEQRPGIKLLEETSHGLESLLHLSKGIEAHEKANLYHGGAWQETLISQPELKRKRRITKLPETLTREDVAREFAAFPFRRELVSAEEEALEEYGKLLDLNTDTVVQLSQNIRLQRTDIEVLMNDIRVRMAERMTEDGPRKARLQELDQELRTMIDRLSDAEHKFRKERRTLGAEEEVASERLAVDERGIRGKRFELEEIYLLRRLIHTADTGHLAAVSHGTPREDLRPDRGSVDISITAAGDKFEFQLKTPKYGVGQAARERQNLALERAHRNIKGSETHLVVLEAENVQDAYEASLRQGARPTSRRDKFNALQPLTDVLSHKERHRLLTVLGLTEAELVQEQAAFIKLQQDRKALEADLEKKRREEAKREAENKKRKAEREEAERLAEVTRRQQELERVNAIEQHRQRQISASQAEREAIAKAKQERIEQKRLQAEREREEREAAARAEEERIKQEHLQALAKAKQERIEQKRLQAEREREERKAAAKRAAEEAKQREKENKARGWPPESLAGLGSAPNLKRLGLLPPDWKDDVSAFLAAKKQFIRLFAKPKTKTATVTDADKPNPAFADVFRSPEEFTSPGTETLERLRLALQKK